jgi:predicted DNA-binding transcriptional regulator AlpA
MRSFSIEQWCEIHALSRSMFYKMAKQGTAPRTFKVGASTRISEQANDEWVKSLEAVVS